MKRLNLIMFITVVVFVLILLSGALFVWSVWTTRERPAVPLALTTRAEIPGIPGARYWVDLENEAFVRDALDKIEWARQGITDPSEELPHSYYLAVSGGGDNGAFGAGLLKGWTQTGTRPTFKVVTGISTGALIAPFAFMGPRYDDTLREVYTGVNPDDIREPRSPVAAVLSDALSDSRPLYNLLVEYMTKDLLDEIGREWTQNGRWLLIGTTDIDSRQPVIWNIGKIAASGHPDSLTLFRKVLLASASIPAAFPPVMIDVEVDGERYQEMHVDGGTTTQVFLFPETLSRVLEVNPRQGRTIYVIRNASLEPAWSSTGRRTLPIATRAIESLIHTQGLGDLYKIEKMCRLAGIDYNLAFIGPEFQVDHPEPFDQEFMRALYSYGFESAKDGYPWKKEPPELGR